MMEPEVAQSPTPAESHGGESGTEIDIDLQADDNEYDTDLEDDKYPKRSVIPDDEKSAIVYDRACKKYGIPVSSSYLRGLKQGKINVSNQGIGPLGAKTIALSLVFDSKVTHLEMSGNFIGTTGIKLVTDMLKENDTITNVDLSNNDIGSYGAELLGHLFDENYIIVNLNISGNGFRECDAYHFGEMLYSYKSGLKTLDLSHNQLGDEGGVLLGKALASNETLQELNLSWTNLKEKGVEKLFSGLKENNSLKDLDISYNGIGDSGAVCIAKCLHSLEGLIRLDLSGNRLGEAGTKLLMASLGHNKILLELRLSKNPITTEGACKAIDLLVDHPECGLQLLEMKDISVSSQFTVSLEKLLEIKPRFRCKHGGFRNQNDIFKFAKKQREENLLNDPFMQLMDYVHQKKLRWVDLFYRLDTDKNLVLSEDEFRSGLKSAGIPVTDTQIDQLLERLDTNHDGEIDFNELLDGQKRYVRRLEKIFGSSPIEIDGSRRRSSAKSRPSSSAKSRPSSRASTRPPSRTELHTA